MAVLHDLYGMQFIKKTLDDIIKEEYIIDSIRVEKNFSGSCYAYITVKRYDKKTKNMYFDTIKVYIPENYCKEYSDYEKSAAKYLKSNIEDIIRNNYQSTGYYVERKKGGCYITTATFKALKTQNDKCEELELFRWYRDKILAKEADGKKLIEEYYQTAPLIVEKINSQPNAEEIYHNLWENYLKPCLEHLKRGEYQKVKTLYVQMVRNLQKEFLNQKENTI